jgi:hypothetical protein
METLLLTLWLAATPAPVDWRDVYAERPATEADALLEAAAAEYGETLEGALWSLHLAQVAEQQWRPTLARRLYERAEGLATRELGPEHLLVERILGEQGRLFREAERYPLAEAALRRAMAIEEKVRGREHASVGRLLQELGHLKALEDRFDEADALAARAVALAHRGGEPLDEAQAMCTQAALLQWRHRDAEAKDRYRDALELFEAQHAEKSAAAAAALNNLAQLSWRDSSGWGKTHAHEALPLMESAVAASEASLGLHHPFTAELLESLSSMYREAGRSMRSLETADRARIARGLRARFCVNTSGIDGCLAQCSLPERICTNKATRCMSTSDGDRHAPGRSADETACFVVCPTPGVAGPGGGCAPGWVCSVVTSRGRVEPTGVCAPDGP